MSKRTREREANLIYRTIIWIINSSENEKRPRYLRIRFSTSNSLSVLTGNIKLLHQNLKPQKLKRIHYQPFAIVLILILKQFNVNFKDTDLWKRSLNEGTQISTFYEFLPELHIEAKIFVENETNIKECT
ncbi:hypothetical protein BpHYR1_046197 [Brachionus plicatilis]|uniref:Uncharacterized protein n=1 Tax=Brachionus plicatilis TaxID=10195 RepID=A0A3M7Q3N3_BRAPC|nr:hypothetical protein BpHYR1_046197 [Brachionus plicatilis]